MLWLRVFAGAIVGAAAAAGVLGPISTASAKGDASGTLGAGGVAKGDISRDPGETDRVTVDLDEGATVDVAFSSAFAPAVVLDDPDGLPVDLGVAVTPRFRVRSFAVTRSGTYEFAISSSDGSQGRWSLTVKQKWARKFPVSGTGQGVVGISMPATGRISAVVSRVRNAPGLPQIVRLEDPSGANLVPVPIQAKKGTAKLPQTPTTTAGTYLLTITPTDGTSGWTGKVTRVVPRPKAGRIGLANGIDPVPFSDGVDALFRSRCAGCHSWAAGYGGVRGRATKAVAYMKSGKMPPNGRVPADQIALVQSWISTGYGR